MLGTRVRDPRSLPNTIIFGHADGAWPIAGGNCSGLVREEDPVPHIVAFRDPSQSTRAIQATIALQSSMSTQLAGLHAKIRAPIRAYEPIKLLLCRLHGSCSLWTASFE